MMQFKRKNVWVLVALACLGGWQSNAMAGGDRDDGDRNRAHLSYDERTNAIVAIDCGPTGLTCKTVYSTAGLSSSSTEVTKIENRTRSLESSTTNLVNRTTGLEGRASSLENSVAGLDTRTGSLEGRAAGLEGSVADLGNRTGHLEGRTSSLENSVAGLDTRTGSLEGRAAGLEGSVVDLGNRTGHLEGRTSSLENSVAGLDTRTGSLEGRAAGLEGSVADLGNRTGGLETAVGNLGKRTDSLENRATALEKNTQQNKQSIQDMALHLGGGASVDKNGRVIAPTYTIKDARTGKTVGHRDVGSALGAVQANVDHTMDTSRALVKSNADDDAKHLGGGASVDKNGRVIAPTYTIKDARTGKTVGHRDVGSALGAVQANVDHTMDTSRALVKSNADDDAKHLGGGASVDKNGRVIAPTYTIKDTATGNTVEHRNVGDALYAVQKNNQTLAQDIASHLGGGAMVDENGRVTAPHYTVTDAVTGKTTSYSTVSEAIGAVTANQGIAAQDTANYLGGGSQVSSDGRVSAPIYTIKDLSSGKQMQWHDVGNALNALDKNTRFVRKEGFAGTASAMAVAGLGQSFRPGQSSIGMATAIYKGQVGYALGGSYMTNNGKFVFKGALSHNGQGNLGAVVGATYYFD